MGQQPVQRYLFPLEPLGQQLCTSPTETAWTAHLNRLFSDADQHRGNCAAQLFVTDAVTAPTR